MTGLDAVLNVSAAVLLGTAGVNGFDIYKVKTAPPVIEGHAVYADPVRAGDEMPILWSIRKTTTCPGTLARVWVGVDGFRLAEQTRPAALPETDYFVNYNIQTHIPSLAPPGELSLSIMGQYECDGNQRRFTLGPVALTVVP